eukprot:SAG31_NODE_32628_length_353_cov_0.988189_1_plen_58_part_10
MNEDNKTKKQDNLEHRRQKACAECSPEMRRYCVAVVRNQHGLCARHSRPAVREEQPHN